MASQHLCLNNICKTTACRIAPAPFAAVQTSVHLSRCCGVQGAESPRQFSSSSAVQQLSTTQRKAIVRPLSQANRNLPKSKAVPVVPYIGTETALQAQYSTSVTQPPPTEPIIHSVFEPGTSTWQYIVADPATNTAAIIDPVLDYDPVSLSITTTSADALLELVHAKGYTIQWILETHAHADHLTSASYLQRKLAEEQGATEADWEGEAGLGKPCIGIGKRIGQVQTLFGRRYGVPPKEYEMGFDKLFEDDETFKIGEMDAMAIHLPGHTPDHLGYKIGDNVFCGDTIFPADVGTARCDFPGGSTQHMWASTQRLLSFSPETRIYSGHDYPPGDARKDPVAFMTVAEHKVKNKHLREGTTEADFLAMRKERDDVLGAPRLLHQSVQVNIRAGKLPEPNEAGHRLLHTPLKLKGVDAW